MDRALLDTDIFSEILKGRNQNVVAKATQYRSGYGHYTISVITVLEASRVSTSSNAKIESSNFWAGCPASSC